MPLTEAEYAQQWKLNREEILNQTEKETKVNPERYRSEAMENKDTRSGSQVLADCRELVPGFFQ